MRRATLSFAAISVGLIAGFISAISALNTFGLKSVAATPAWSEWQLAGNDAVLVYTLGHFLNDGQLPPPKSARSFERNSDDGGNSLRADCVYVVQGKVTPSRWWTMSVAQAGKAAPRSELTAGEAVVSQDGSLKVTISAHPMPGNWIIPPESGSVSLHYIINEAPAGQIMPLPTITKMGC